MSAGQHHESPSLWGGCIIDCGEVSFDGMSNFEQIRKFAVRHPVAKVESPDPRLWQHVGGAISGRIVRVAKSGVIGWIVRRPNDDGLVGEGLLFDLCLEREKPGGTNQSRDQIANVSQTCVPTRLEMRAFLSTHNSWLLASEGLSR